VTVLLITPEKEDEIAAAIERARMKTIPWDKLRGAAMTDPKPMLNLADRNKDAPRRPQPELVMFVGGIEARIRDHSSIQEWRRRTWMDRGIRARPLRDQRGRAGGRATGRDRVMAGSLTRRRRYSRRNCAVFVGRLLPPTKLQPAFAVRTTDRNQWTVSLNLALAGRTDPMVDALSLVLPD
jgi:hypothetical protein